MFLFAKSCERANNKKLVAKATNITVFNWLRHFTSFRGLLVLTYFTIF